MTKLKQILFIVALIALSITKGWSQNPGLLISEVYINPAGTDSCREFVELIASTNINFSLTPYTIIVNNNGVANANGWIAGGALSYAFQINSGSVSTGDVVYVGGSCMSPTINIIKSLNVKYVNGDGGIGTANAAGVFGNGGGNADGIAVFNLPVASITSSTVPRDAIFWGTGIGTASVNAGIDGYQLPVNDFYSGGKLNSSSFITSDPGGDILTLGGLFNTSTNSWAIPRAVIITSTALSNSLTSTSSVSLTSNSAAPMGITFLSNDTTALESSSAATIYLKLTSSSTSASTVSILVSALSNASSTDYTLATSIVTIAANTPSNTTLPVSILINNDAVIESAEYVVLRLSNPINATIGSTSQCTFYIADNDKPIPAPSNALSLNLLSSFSNSITGTNSAEIVVHDPTTQRLYIANSIGGKLDIIDLINPSSPTLLSSISVTPYGNINSVAVKNGTVACAIENSINPQDSGKVVFFDKNGVFIKDVKVGMMPDMIVFNHAGTKVLTANEGEPNNNYSVTPSNDPDGSVSIINISGGIANLTQTNVANVTFTAYNGQENALRAQGIRIYGPHNMASKDFEPEYITVAKDDSKAWVTLQENNAIVEINLSNNSIASLRALGTKDHSLLNNGLDASNQTKGVNISNFQVKGFYLPDAIASYSIGSTNYLITANEGDARAYTTFSEEKRVSALTLDPVKFPNGSELKNNWVLGRLNATDKNGDTDNDGDIDTIYCYGSRSFSIWNATTGNLVYDSKDDLELITSTNSFSVMFNASNTSSTKKDRSDDKGPEPEGVAIGQIGSNYYAFIALERIGGVMVYDVTNPNSPVFVTYVYNRNFATNGPDRGAVGIIFIPHSESPFGQHIVIAANEISSSLSIWGIPGCSAPISSSLSVSGNTVACANQAPVLSVPVGSGLTFQWYNGTTAVNGATANAYAPTSSGNYSVQINGGPNCTSQSLTQSVTISPGPSLTVVSNNSLICTGESATLTATGSATSYTWNNSSTGTVLVVSPSVTTTYTLAGTGANSCQGETTFVQNVSPCTGIGNALVNDEPILIYPNPAQTYFVVDYKGYKTLSLKLYNTIGQLVYSNDNYESKSMIECNNLPNGIYYLKIYKDNQDINTYKLIIQ